MTPLRTSSWGEVLACLPRGPSLSLWLFQAGFRNIPHAELAAPRRANQVTAERKGITEAVWAEHLSDFEPPGADEHVLRYGLTEHAALWVIDHFRP
jgi:hypothetical protein